MPSGQRSVSATLSPVTAPETSRMVWVPSQYWIRALPAMQAAIATTEIPCERDHAPPRRRTPEPRAGPGEASSASTSITAISEK